MFPFRFSVVDDDASEVLAMMKDVDALGVMGEEEMEEVGESVENALMMLSVARMLITFI